MNNKSYNMNRGWSRITFFLFLTVLSISSLASAQEPVDLTIAPETQAPMTQDEIETIDVYKRANQSVVNINTRGYVRDMFGVYPQEGSGSGVIVDAEQGLVITNYHVVENIDRDRVGNVAVTLSTGKTFASKVIGKDKENDIALLKLEDRPDDLVEIRFGDSSRLLVGQTVYAIGSPFGFSQTLTKGIISALERSLQIDAQRQLEHVIQTDAAINPGNSGGPLLDSLGRMIGINTLIISNSQQSSGIGFSIPANIVRDSLPLLIKYGKVPRPKIGVAISDTQFGPVITFVQPGSPADQAGLAGAHQSSSRGLFSFPVVDVSDADFVLAINGKQVQTSDECYRELSRVESGKPIEILVRRGVSRGKARVVKIKPVLG
jgi:S1-C subfamily serine protease